MKILPITKSISKLLSKRLFAPASESAVYTKETAPRVLKLLPRDILEMHLNDGSKNMETLSDSELAVSLMKRFADADHGTAIRIGNGLKNPDSGLSGYSAPLFFINTRRWAMLGKGGYFTPKGEPEMVLMNKVAQLQPRKINPKSFNKHYAEIALEDNPGYSVMKPFTEEYLQDLTKLVQAINDLGYNFKLPLWSMSKNPFKEGHPLHDIFVPKPVNILIPNIGFLKYKQGGKI